jgi:protein-disulfide isomerase
MSKQFLAILAAIAVIFVGLIIYSGNKDSNNPSSVSNAKPTSNIEGSTSSGVKLVEYGDFQCPACGLYYPTVEQVVAKYKDQIQFQFRNLPLPSLHPNAFAAARAGEAAAKQDKFFEMYDKLYQNQNDWASSKNPLQLFTGYAQQIGLNVDKFTSDYKSTAVNSAINADLAAFDKTGVEKSTPSFFLDGKHIDGNQLLDKSGQPSVDTFSKLIDKAIADKQKSE